MLGYLAARPPAPGSLFRFGDGSPLSRPKLVQCLREALRAARIDDNGFSGHGFCIGAATAAARGGSGPCELPTFFSISARVTENGVQVAYDHTEVKKK